MPKNNSAGTQTIAVNRRARHDYTIDSTVEAGLVLQGTEGANIPEYLNGTWTNHAPKRKRKLLLHADQIMRFERGVEAKGYTIVPLSLYFKDGRAKVEIALAKGKREYDKRQALREQQDKRDAQRQMRLHNLGAA